MLSLSLLKCGVEIIAPKLMQNQQLNAIGWTEALNLRHLFEVFIRHAVSNPSCQKENLSRRHLRQAPAEWQRYYVLAEIRLLDSIEPSKNILGAGLGDPEVAGC